jgi:quercetin dioxygenase-like cupin family protein
MKRKQRCIRGLSTWVLGLSIWVGLMPLYLYGQDMSSFVLPKQKTVTERGDGWVFYQYFNDATVGTTQSLVGMAVLKAGKEIHPPHKHSDEEFLLITQGEGEWSVKGEVFNAQAGDLLYAAPWDSHGVKNTGREDLVFVVFKWQSGGVNAVKKPKETSGK